MVKGTRRDISRSLRFFHGRGVSIEDLIEVAVEDFHYKIISLNERIRSEDIVGDLAILVLSLPCKPTKQTRYHLTFLAELTVGYVIARCKGKNYRNIYDFIAKTYSKG